MLQWVLTGRAQEVYSSLCDVNSQVYSSVKWAVLKAYELVPEAYQQWFRTWRKREKQSHLKFVCELTTHFIHWCSASGVNDFDGLCELLLLENLKN